MIYKPFKIDYSIFYYQKWKHLLPLTASDNDFECAFRRLYKHDYNECHVRKWGGAGLLVSTPSCCHYDGGYCEITDTPLLGEDDSFYYIGGCTWATDLVGDRYYKIDEKTLLPVNFNEVIDRHIIKLRLLH